MFKLHDRAYKKLFSNKVFFQELLETFVDEKWVKEIDFESSERLDKSFIAEHYKSTESDLIYKVKFQGQEAYIYVLLEFQSTVSWFMALRVLHYLCSFWLDYAENLKITKKRGKKGAMKKLPPIFPLVLYNGKKRWTAGTELKQILEKPELLGDYTPIFKYFKIAENEYSTEKLLQIRNLVSTLFLAETTENLELIKQEIINLFDKKTDKQGISLLINWYAQLVIHDRHELENYEELYKIYHDKTEVIDMLETAMEKQRKQWLIEGEQLGIVKGEQLGIVKGEQLGIVKGEQLGIVKGKQLGIKKGKELGERKGKIKTLINQLQARFRVILTQKQRLKICRLKNEELTNLLNQIFDLTTLPAFLNETEKVKK